MQPPTRSRRATRSPSNAVYAVLTLALLATPIRLRAQPTASAVVVGERLRVRSPGGTTYIGRLVAFDRDSLVLRTDDDAARTISVPRTGLDVAASDGTHRRWRRGMFVGLIAGAGGGTIFGVATYSPCSQLCIFAQSREGWVALGAAAGTVLGTLTGGIVGSFFESERWRPVTLGSDGVRVGLRLGISLAALAPAG